MSKVLSICIPTYNFGQFIGETLDSILPQVTDGVEVIVLDGGSTDCTAEVVADRQRINGHITYLHQDFRGGIDRDIEKVVSMASGKYCWLFSADDIMLPGAVDKVLQKIKLNYDVYICEHALCNLDMQIISEHPPFDHLLSPRLFDLGDTVQRKEYFHLARTSEAFFSFLAGPIFKKSVWDAATIPDSFRDTCWIVAGHLLSRVPYGISVYYMRERLLYKREGNDSFSNGSFVRQLQIVIVNFQYVANKIFSRSSEEVFHIRRVLRNEISFKNIMYAKLRTSLAPEKEDKILLKNLVRMHYSDPILFNRVKYGVFLMTPPFILRLLHNISGSLRCLKTLALFLHSSK